MTYHIINLNCRHMKIVKPIPCVIHELGTGYFVAQVRGLHVRMLGTSNGAALTNLMQHILDEYEEAWHMSELYGVHNDLANLHEYISYDDSCPEFWEARDD